MGVGEREGMGTRRGGIDDSGVLGEPVEGEHGPWLGRRP